MKPTLFVHIPKTGGTSWEQALADACSAGGVRWSNMDHAAPFGEQPTIQEYVGVFKCKHETLSAFLGTRGLTLSQIKHWQVVSIVRNPWDRLISGYASLRWKIHGLEEHLFLKECAPTFPAFCEWLMTEKPEAQVKVTLGRWAMPQVNWLMVDKEFRADFVFRTEQLRYGWQVFCEASKLPFKPLRKTNTSEHPTRWEVFAAIAKAQSQYTDLPKRLGEYYAADCEQFGYKYED